MENLVEKIEIWKKVESGGDVIEFGSGQHLKKVVILINGHPIFLDEEMYLEKKQITKEEGDFLTKEK